MIPMSIGAVAAAVGADGETEGSVDPAPMIRRVTTDSRDVLPGDLFIALRGDRFDGHAFIGDVEAKGAVASLCDRAWAESSDGISARSLPCIVVPDTIEALGRLAAHYRRQVMDVATVVVAITGTNGKTTTKSMLDHVLTACFPGRAAPRSFNNHIGVPLTLLSADRDDRYLIVEIGSNAPGEVAALAAMASPRAAVITSVGEAHLETFGGIEGVAAEKVSLLSHVKPDGLAVVNIDCREVRALIGEAASSRLMTIGTDSAARLSVAGADGDLRQTRFTLDGRFAVELPMPGLHHATNAAAAFAVARWFGMPPARIIERLRTFPALPGRTCVFELGGVTVVDDTYNANPASMLAAITALRRGATGRCLFVMGDMLELGDAADARHRRSVQAVVDADIDVLVTVGEAAGNAARALRLDRTATRWVSCRAADVASNELLALLHVGDSVWIKGSRALGLERVVDRLRKERSGGPVASRGAGQGVAVG